MTNLSPALRASLESDCGHSLESILADHRTEDYQALMEILVQPPKQEYRLKVIHLLGRWGEQDAVSTIEDILPTLSELERSRAIDTLGRLGGPQAEAAVLKHVDDASPQVRKFVVYALKRLNSPNSREVLQRITHNDSADFVRKAGLQR